MSGMLIMLLRQPAGKGMVIKKPYFSVVAAALAAALSGCGGGSNAVGGEFVGATTTSSTAITGTAQGLFAGIASNGRYFNTLVLENNQYYIVYGGLAGDAFSVAGLITGTGESSNGSFTSADLREFPAFGLPILGTLSGTYTPGASFSAVVATRGTAVTYPGTVLDNTSYVYNARTSLAVIAGTWSVVSGMGVPASLRISSSGAFSGTSANCDFSGSITPRASGKNVFDVTIRFGASPCALADQALSGNAVSYLQGSGKRQLLVMASDATRSVASVFAGIR